MKAKVLRTGFIDGRLAHEGEIIDVKQPGAWYEPVAEEKPKAEGGEKKPKAEGGAKALV